MEANVQRNDTSLSATPIASSRTCRSRWEPRSLARRTGRGHAAEAGAAHGACRSALRCHKLCEALKLESKKTIDLVKFVDVDDIDPRYFERPYYVGPGDKLAGEGFVVIRDALRKTGKVGEGWRWGGRRYA